MEDARMPQACPTRAGKRAVTVYLRQGAWRQPKRLALDEDRRLHSRGIHEPSSSLHARSTT
jgi:hypothetical protein